MVAVAGASQQRSKFCLTAMEVADDDRVPIIDFMVRMRFNKSVEL